MRRLLSLLLLAGLVLTTRPASAVAPVERVAGPTAAETAAAVASEAMSSASDAVLARGDVPYDALAGAYVAGTHISPVLLTGRDAVPPASLDALASLRVWKVHLLGGTGSISEAVAADLHARGYEVVRWAGADRYATAAAAARSSGSVQIGVLGDAGRAAILASGAAPWDALAAGPLSFGQQWPVLLSTRDELPTVTEAALRDLGIRAVVVTGGEAAIGPAVVERLEAMGIEVRRVAGADRTGTAAALADLMAEIGLVGDRILVASATSSADALGAAPLAAPDAPILLCASVDTCGPTTLGWAARESGRIESVVVVGGTAAVSDAAAAQVGAVS